MNLHTYICDQELFAIIKTGNLRLTLRDEVVLFDVLVEQEFVCWSQDVCSKWSWPQVNVAVRQLAINGSNRCSSIPLIAVGSCC